MDKAHLIGKLPVLGIVSLNRRVLTLYKRAVRNAEAWNPDRAKFRIEAVKIRARFDANKDIKDSRLVKMKLLEGEKELYSNWHPVQKIFGDSPGGILYERHDHVPDWVLDFWDPIEKAAYPKYFAQREKAKKEYEEYYKKQYGDVKLDEHYLEELPKYS
ncbi:NADH dehydrogenase [ubiquinone] 1 beta subcomplex subunit 9 [Prorops nasuta]|uniref:NADH dehydrogenase [ubiquinone] 1 beta subcomplex subunit 9 n=1 Tax=Prorops nasuta TaxID=863751 RepID=UPI0034CE3810